MKKIGIDEQRKIQTDILSDVAMFCEAHDIKYFLAYGTLLGAIRHKGYIPWDDDIDIWMPEPDYERFLSEYNSEKYKVIHSGNSDNYNLFFAKVHDERTRFQESYTAENDYGVFIDIFPLHGFSGHWQYKRIQYALCLIRVKNSFWNSRKSLSKKITNVFGKCLLYILSKKSIVKYMERVLREVPYEDSEWIHSFMVNAKPFKKEDFEESIFVEFERKKFRAPFQYDKILTTIYGDYMKLPPESDRVLKHQAKVWWK